MPSWLGQPGFLSTTLCQEMLRVLVEPGEEERWLSRSANLELDALREAYDGLLEVGTAPLEDVDDGVQWHTFAGGGVNRLLAAGLHRLTGFRWTAGNLSLKGKDVALTVARDGLRRLDELDWEEVAAAAAHDMARGMLSKFQPCLPAEDEDRLLAERLLDVRGTRGFLEAVRVVG